MACTTDQHIAGVSSIYTGGGGGGGGGVGIHMYQYKRSECGHKSQAPLKQCNK